MKLCIIVFYSQFPEISAFIMRRFKGENDVEETYDLVRKVRFIFLKRSIFMCTI
jgi:hypothetical protein